MPVSPSQVEPAKSKKAIAIGIAIAIILLILGAVIFWPASTPPTPATALTNIDNSIALDNQDPDSVAVLIKKFSCRVSCFVEIHADNSGQLGPIVATSKLYQPGEYANTSLIMTLTPGASYHAMLHGDDGNGIFTNPQQDPALLDNSGNVVSQMFKVNLVSEGGEKKG